MSDSNPGYSALPPRSRMALGEIIFLRGQERRDGVTVTEVEEVAFGTARHRSGEAGKSWTIRRPLLKYAEDLFAREFMNGFEDTVISFFEKSVRAQKTFGHQRMNGTNKQGVYIHLIIHTLLQKLLAGYGGSSDDVDRRNNTQHSWYIYADKGHRKRPVLQPSSSTVVRVISNHAFAFCLLHSSLNYQVHFSSS